MRELGVSYYLTDAIPFRDSIRFKSICTQSVPERVHTFYMGARKVLLFISPLGKNDHVTQLHESGTT